MEPRITTNVRRPAVLRPRQPVLRAAATSTVVSRRPAFGRKFTSARRSPEPVKPDAPLVSFAIFAWNEEEAIGPMLESLLKQSLFARLQRRGLVCEVLCVLNGCTDRTAERAAAILSRTAAALEPRRRSQFRWRVENLAERGKLNAWNQFVHSLAAREAEFLFFADADILLPEPDTLWRMLTALQRDSEAHISVDRPVKELGFLHRRDPRRGLSLAAADLTSSSGAQLCAQLYCMRAETARRIYLPRDLAACEDGFIKSLVCTDFLKGPVNPRRICLAEGAEHQFEAYTGMRAILKNQKRQVLGQTIVHVLIDQFLPTMASASPEELAPALKRLDATEPGWLKRLIAQHLTAVRAPWRLYPGLLSYRLRRLRHLPLGQALRCFPAALAGFVATLAASFMAYSALKRGSLDYWPRAERAGFKDTCLNPSAERQACSATQITQTKTSSAKS